MARVRACLAAMAGAFAIMLPGIAPGQDRSVLPVPVPDFAGTMKPSLDAAGPSWPDRVKAPDGAPNILLVLTDDVGFGAASTFGGPVPTPNLDRLARQGAVYNNFHTTAMCSPTRAALLTGRNHHAVGTGALTNVPMGFPGYDGIIPPQSATLGRILKGNGFSTAWIGKNHNVPDDETGETGPFDRWPVEMGFDEFYGFIGSETDQFRPVLYHGNTRLVVPDRGPDYILDRDLADHAIGWLRQQQAETPDKPFFLYYATGSAHAPQQAPRDWIARFGGKFDSGWDVLREQTFARQLRDGIVPRGTTMSPRPAEIPAWDSLSPDRQRLYARYMEVFAAMLAFQDYQFGRILDELEAQDELDDTLIVFIEGDNGASAEGGPEGSLNELMQLVGLPDQSFDEQLANIDTLGGPRTYQVYPAGWAWSTNTPFPLYKQIASHLGGTRNGLVISWPEKIARPGEVRRQFHHVIDIAPTLLEAAGIPQPRMVDGTAQDPFDGTGMAYTFVDPAADDQRTTQYFELLGNRAIYRDGWLASTNPGRMPWQPLSASKPEDFTWSLYNLDEDFAQANDLVSEYPEKLAELREMFDREARRYDVYPLRAALDVETSDRMRRPREPRSRYDYRGKDIHIAWSQQPRLVGPFTIEVALGTHSAGETLTGALLGTGSDLSGWAFALENNVPVVRHAASSAAADRFTVRADSELGAQDTTLRFVFTPDNRSPVSPGTMAIFAGSRPIGSGRIGRPAPLTMGPGESFDIGNDTGRPVMEYPEGAAFSGTIETLTVTLGNEP